MKGYKHKKLDALSHRYSIYSSDWYQDWIIDKLILTEGDIGKVDDEGRFYIDFHTLYIRLNFNSGVYIIYSELYSKLITPYPKMKVPFRLDEFDVIENYLEEIELEI